MKIVLHNPGHNGDILHTLGIVTKIVKDNPDKEFVIIPACSSYLFNELLSDKVILAEHPVSWNFDKNIYHKQNFISENHNSLCNYYNGDIYINMWRLLIEDIGTCCISLATRVKIIENLLEQINKNTGIKINFNCISWKELIPKMPCIDIDSIHEKLKSYNKKLIFFYNQNSYSGCDHHYPSNIDEIIIQNLLTDYGENYKIILSKPCNIINKNLVDVENEFGNLPSYDGKNLIINANIANLCDKVYFKNNGGSFFILNQINIANKNVQYYYIGTNNFYNVITNEYGLNCILYLQ